MTPYYDENNITLYLGDARAIPLADASVQTCVTSPPYWGLRDYGVDGQIGLEATPAEYVANMVAVFREVRRVLKPDGVIWVNLGDSYASDTKGQGGTSKNSTLVGTANADRVRFSLKVFHGVKNKDLIGIPWRVAFALQADGWYLRSDIIWHKPNPMPESVTDRPTKAHEYIFLLSKADRYYYDAGAIAEPIAESSIVRLSQNVDAQIGSARVPFKTNGNMKAVGGRNLREAKRGQCANNTGNVGFDNRWTKERRAEIDTRNKRSVWAVNVNGYPGAHFATFPPALIEPCILAGSRPGDLVLDPFNGSGTTGEVCRKWGRRYVGMDLNVKYLELSKKRFEQGVLFGAA